MNFIAFQAVEQSLHKGRKKKLTLAGAAVSKSESGSESESGRVEKATYPCPISQQSFTLDQLSITLQICIGQLDIGYTLTKVGCTLKKIDASIL